MCDDHDEMHIGHYFDKLDDAKPDGVEIGEDVISIRSDMFRRVEAVKGGSAIYTHLSPWPKMVAHTPEEVEEIIKTQRELWECGKDFEHVTYRGPKVDEN